MTFRKVCYFSALSENVCFAVVCDKLMPTAKWLTWEVSCTINRRQRDQNQTRSEETLSNVVNIWYSSCCCFSSLFRMAEITTFCIYLFECVSSKVKFIYFFLEWQTMNCTWWHVHSNQHTKLNHSVSEMALVTPIFMDGAIFSSSFISSLFEFYPLNVSSFLCHMLLFSALFCARVCFLEDI